MMQYIQPVHAYLGEGLVAVALVGLAFALISRSNGWGRTAAQVVMRGFGVLISIQWLLGIVNYFALPAPSRPTLVHPILMTAVVALFHIVQGRSRRTDQAEPPLAAVFGAAAIAIVVGISLV